MSHGNSGAENKKEPGEFQVPEGLNHGEQSDSSGWPVSGFLQTGLLDLQLAERLFF